MNYYVIEVTSRDGTDTAKYFVTPSMERFLLEWTLAAEAVYKWRVVGEGDVTA